MLTAAIFDMDGLLIDSERSIMNAWLSVAEAAGKAISPAEYVKVIGRSSPESDAILIELFGSSEGFKSAQTAVRKKLECTPPSERFPLKPGATALLSLLSSSGIPCAVASSSSRAEIEDRLSAVGVWHHFSSAAGGDEVIRGKPDPAVYLLAASRLGVDPNRCLAFEDSHNGALAALSAGAHVVIVPDLLAPTAELESRSLCVLHSLVGALPKVGHWFCTVIEKN